MPVSRPSPMLILVTTLQEPVGGHRGAMAGVSVPLCWDIHWNVATAWCRAAHLSSSCPVCCLSPAGSYLPSSYSFSPYGSKASGSDDSDKSRASPSVSCKSSSESKALDILQQHASHYKSKSPTVRVRSFAQLPGASRRCLQPGGAPAVGGLGS